MQLDIPKDETHRLTLFMDAVRHEFPEITRALNEVAHRAKNGVTIEIRPLVYKRTRPQENYYRKWCREFADFCGSSPDKMHNDLLCECFGSEWLLPKFGAPIQVPEMRSEDSMREEYSTLIETLIRVAAELGFMVPPPIKTEEMK